MTQFRVAEICMFAPLVRLSFSEHTFKHPAGSPARPFTRQERMQMRYMKAVPTAVLALLATAACNPADSPVSAVPASASANRGAPQAQFRTTDDEFARVARAEVPGFAGFYLQNDGTPVVRLVDPSQRG